MIKDCEEVCPGRRQLRWQYMTIEHHLVITLCVSIQQLHHAPTPVVGQTEKILLFHNLFNLFVFILSSFLLLLFPIEVVMSFQPGSVWHMFGGWGGVGGRWWVLVRKPLPKLFWPKLLGRSQLDPKYRGGLFIIWIKQTNIILDCIQAPHVGVNSKDFVL